MPGGGGNPCVRGLNRLSGSTTAIDYFHPNVARTLIGVQGRVEGQVLYQSRPTLLAPIVGSRPKQQFGPSHERDCQLASGNRFDAIWPKSVISVEQGRRRHWYRGGERSPGPVHGTRQVRRTMVPEFPNHPIECIHFPWIAVIRWRKLAHHWLEPWNCGPPIGQSTRMDDLRHIPSLPESRGCNQRHNRRCGGDISCS